MKIKVSYSQKIWRGIKFGGLVVYNTTENSPKFPTCIYTYGDPVPNCQIEIHQYSCNQGFIQWGGQGGSFASKLPSFPPPKNLTLIKLSIIVSQ